MFGRPLFSRGTRGRLAAIILMATLLAGVTLAVPGRAFAAATITARNGYVDATAFVGDCEVRRTRSAPSSPPAPLDWSDSVSASLSEASPACPGADQAAATGSLSMVIVTDANGGLRKVSASARASASASDDPNTPPTASASGQGDMSMRFTVAQAIAYQFSGSISGGDPIRTRACFTGPSISACNTSVNGILQPGFYSIFAEASANADDATGTSTVTLTVGAPVGKRFDWSMPDRYGADRDGDGRFDSFQPDGPLDPTPDGFQVDFTDGLPQECDAGLTRTWFIDGTPVAPSDPRVIEYDPSSCEFSYAFPAEGTYRVTLEVARGGSIVDTVTEDVLVQDWVIVSLGDSVASGEGVPDLPAAPTSGRPAVWQNFQCHRSALAGPAVAARQFEILDPKTSVTFVHLACSGATVDQGLLGPYQGQEPGVPLEPQIQAMRTILGDREIDAALISIGANDVHFAEVVEKCLQDEPCYDTENPTSAASLFESLIVSLPGKYDDVAAALAEAEHPVPAERVMLTEYFDPTRDEHGDYCDGEILTEMVPPLVRAATYPHGSITLFESAWASESMLTRLNAAGSDAARRGGWQRLTGPFETFRAHGYCTEDHWVVQLSESLRSQYDYDGTLHPNVPGHAIGYAPPIFLALRGSLYEDGDLARPRPPA